MSFIIECNNNQIFSIHCKSVRQPSAHKDEETKKTRKNRDFFIFPCKLGVCFSLVFQFFFPLSIHSRVSLVAVSVVYLNRQEKSVCVFVLSISSSKKMKFLSWLLPVHLCLGGYYLLFSIRSIWVVVFLIITTGGQFTIAAHSSLLLQFVIIWVSFYTVGSNISWCCTVEIHVCSARSVHKCLNS